MDFPICFTGKDNKQKAIFGVGKIDHSWEGLSQKFVSLFGSWGGGT